MFDSEIDLEGGSVDDIIYKRWVCRWYHILEASFSVIPYLWNHVLPLRIAVRSSISFFYCLFKKVFERNFYVKLSPSMLCQILYQVYCVQVFIFFFLGDIERVGECLDKYWTHKKLMAHGCEPTSVKAMMERIKPYAYGNFSFLFFFVLKLLAKQTPCNCLFSFHPVYLLVFYAS